MSLPKQGPQSSDPLCPVCHIRVVERCCMDCGYVFCLKCARQKVSEFNTCSRCGPSGVEDTEEGAVCRECGEPAQLATRREHLCANCGSNTVEPIHNMRKNLASRFRTTYYKLRVGHKLLAGFATRLRTLRWQVRELRTAGFFHNPEIEKKLLELVRKRVSAANERIVFRAQKAVERHQASKARFLHPEKWKVADFPLLAGLIEGIQEDIYDYERYCVELVKELEDLLVAIEKELLPLQRWHALFSKYAEHLDIGEEEKAVAAIPLVSLSKTETGKGMSQGTLFVTTQRLLFLGQTGLIKRGISVIRSVPLSAITGTTEEGRLRRRLLITTEEEVLRLRGSSETLQEIPKTIALAQNFSEHSLVTVKGSLRVTSMKVDIMALRDALDKLIDRAVTRDIPSVPSALLTHLTPTQSHQTAHYPHSRPYAESKVDSLPQSRLFQLRQQKYSLQATMKLLKREFDEGKIANEGFFKQYRSLSRELYLIETRISEVTGERSATDESFPF